MTNSRPSIFLLMTMLISIIFSSCELLDTDATGKKMTEEILECLSTENSDRIKNLLCKKTREMPDIDEQIEAAMEFFEGKVVSHGTTSVGEGSSTESFKIEWWRIEPNTFNIITDSGKKYHMIFYSYLIYSDDKDIVGISKITIDSDYGKVEIGKHWD